MKRIVLNIDEKVVGDFKNRAMVRAMSGQGDILGHAWMKVIEAIENGDVEVELKFKREPA